MTALQLLVAKARLVVAGWLLAASVWVSPDIIEDDR